MRKEKKKRMRKKKEEDEKRKKEEDEKRKKEEDEKRKKEEDEKRKKEGKKDINNTIVIEFDKNNNKINIDLKNLELFSPDIEEIIVHKQFTDRTTFCKLDEASYNLFTTDKEITLENTPNENTFVLFAVKTTSRKYYLGYCHNGNSIKNNGLFSCSEYNNEIKMLCNGYDLNNINSMFSYNTNLGNIVFTKDFDTKNVTNMSFMFNKCSSLKELNLSNFNTNNVIVMDGMFFRCSSLKKLNLNNFNTNNVTDMSCMFNWCSSLTKLDLSKFNTNNVTNMMSMFYECSSLKELNLSNFNTSKVENMNYMFDSCTNLTMLSLPNKVINDNVIRSYVYMFDRCDKLKGNVTTNDKEIKKMYGQFIKKN